MRAILKVAGVKEEGTVRHPLVQLHINVTELEAVMKGNNLALKQGLKEIEIKNKLSNSDDKDQEEESINQRGIRNICKLISCCFEGVEI